MNVQCAHRCVRRHDGVRVAFGRSVAAAAAAAAAAATAAAAAAAAAGAEPAAKRARAGRKAAGKPDDAAGADTGTEAGGTDPAQVQTQAAAPSKSAAAQSQKRAETWNLRFQELKAFHEGNGHYHIPKTEPLSQWSRDQRTQYSKWQKGQPTSLSDERRAALDSIGFPWRLWTKKSWDERIEQLRAFKDEHGHVNVPIRRNEKQSLATWVDEQRKLYRQKHQKGAKVPLTAEREKQLEDLGFQWYRYGPTSWQARFEELKEYKAEHGGTFVVPERGRVLSWRPGVLASWRTCMCE